MKNDLKRFEIAGAQADCTVAALAGSFHPLAGAFWGRRGGELGGDGGRDGGRECEPPLSLPFLFFWTVELSSNSCASLTRGRQQHWERGCLGQMDLPGTTSPLTSHHSFSY